MKNHKELSKNQSNEIQVIEFQYSVHLIVLLKPGLRRGSLYIYVLNFHRKLTYLLLSTFKTHFTSKNEDHMNNLRYIQSIVDFSANYDFYNLSKLSYDNKFIVKYGS